MFQRILVPVDGSATSNTALQQAIQLANERHAQLRIVHVVDEVSMTLDVQTIMDDFIKAVREAGKGILQTAVSIVRDAGLKVESQLLEITAPGKHIADVLVEDAQQWPADLIVIGTHGRRGINRLLLGSVTEKVARLATTPVLLIRGE